MLSAVRDLTREFPGGTTNTAEALSLAAKQLYGGSDDREDADNLVFLLTDGRPNVNIADTNPKANQLKEVARLIPVVTNGVVDEDFTKELASSPKEAGLNYFLTLDSTRVIEMLNDMRDEKCKGKAPARYDFIYYPIALLFIIEMLGSGRTSHS